MIICIADDPKLNTVLDTITNIVCTGTKDDGNVFAITVDDVFDMRSQKSGVTSI